MAQSFRDYIGQGAPQQTAPQPTGGYGDFLMSSLPQMLKEIMSQRDRDTYQRALARGNAPDSPLGYQPQDLSRTGATAGGPVTQSYQPNPGAMGASLGQSISQSAPGRMGGSAPPTGVNVNPAAGQSLGQYVGTGDRNMPVGMGMMQQNIQRAIPQMAPKGGDLQQNGIMGQLVNSMPQPMSRGKELPQPMSRAKGMAPQQVPTGALAELMRRKIGR